MLVQTGDPALGAAVVARGSARVSRTGDELGRLAIAVREHWLYWRGALAVQVSRDTEVGTVVTRGSSAGSCKDVP